MGDADIPSLPEPPEAEQPSINPITKKPWTQEDRDEASRRAKELVALGKFGGQHHGRKRKRPAYAVIAATAQRNAKKLAEELINIALHGETPKLRMDAIKMLTDLELKAMSNRREEEEHLLTLPRDELQRKALGILARITGEDFDIELGDDDVEEDEEDDESGDDELEAEAPAYTS